MATIKHYLEQADGKYERIDSSSLIDVKVVRCKANDSIEIVCSRKGHIAKVTKQGIELNGLPVEQVDDGAFGMFGWQVVSPYQYVLSVRTTRLVDGLPCFKYGDKTIATISRGGGFIEAVLNYLKNHKWQYEAQYFAIEFDKNWLDADFALCLLLRESCKDFSPPS